MKRIPALTSALVAMAAGWAVCVPARTQEADAPPPLKALLIAGGCCHDYGSQHAILSEGIQSRANVRVDVLYSTDTTTRAMFDIYKDPDWAKGYDVIIHDECSADVKDAEIVKNILDAHKSVPAVNLHCAMHSYRTGTDEWFRFVGIQSSAHGPQEPIAIEFVGGDHPATKGLGDWTTIREELYNNIDVFDGTTPLATGVQKYERGGKTTEAKSVVVWAHENAGARVFSTTLGHNNETVKDDRYLEMVTRGLLWACGKDGADWRKPYKGENTVRRIEPEKKKTADAGAKPEAAAKPADYSGSGNVPPRVTDRSAEAEAEILKDVKVAEGFAVSLFAAPPAVNYPVFVAAAVDGTLFVSSDGNGSLGRNPHRGRILRLRDTDGDGRADEVKSFVNDVDSPRGLVWDHDRLYVVHPPHLSVFIDRNGDGVSDEHRILVRDIAFGFADRPADHTTNGLTLGIDGWLYIAGGDFGFLKATGSDGRTLQHRGGGVIRVRPDGSGLEIVSTGTRNILEVAIGPEMEMFARDNTNDGGGWDVRFEHFTGLDDHGYPRLFRNFGEECVPPLAIYGGGSGCGAVFIDEPGFPEGWGKAPFTADWGTNGLYRHAVERSGATFRETASPKPLVRMTRPTDADVDGNSAVYAASWKGATFDWAGPDAGYVVRVVPKGFDAPPVPDFAAASADDLVALLRGPGHRRRLEAQRTLIRRFGQDLPASLFALAKDRAAPETARVAAAYAIAWCGRLGDIAGAIAPDDPLLPTVVRASAGTAIPTPRNPADPNVRMARLVALAAVPADSVPAAAAEILTFFGDDDPAVAHAAVRGFAKLDRPEPALRELEALAADAPASARVTALLRSLAMMHRADVVDELVRKFERATGSDLRAGILTSLCRLYFREGEWKGDSWGTRPDTRGPYYQPERWSESDRIAAVLKAAMDAAPPAEAARLAVEMNRHRIDSETGLDRLLELAAREPKLVPEVVNRLAAGSDLPAAAVPLLATIAEADDSPPEQLARTVVCLARADGDQAAAAMLSALAKLDRGRDRRNHRDTAARAFLRSPKLENAHQVYERIAAAGASREAGWAEAALLQLAGRVTGSPEAREQAAKALDTGWNDPARRFRIVNAVRRAGAYDWADRVLAAVDDPDRNVAEAARRTARAMKFQKRENEPLVGALPQDEAIARATKTEGDPGFGEYLFSHATCTACHTTSESEAQRGPYLGNIAATYRREELARSILDPNNSIAQGFTTNVFTLKDGTTEMGFVTLEAADRVTIRNIAAEERTIDTGEIVSRDKSPVSLMPPALVANLTVHEFASLLDYLESLKTKG